MLGQRQCGRLIRRRAVYNEVVISAHKDADHLDSGLEPRVGNGAADGEMIDDLARESLRILVRRRINFVPLKSLLVFEMLFAGFGNYGHEMA
jgi:hypothetical protein